MRRRGSVLDYFVQKRKGRLGQETGSLVPDLGVGLSVALISLPHESDLVSSSAIYSSVYSMNIY